MAFVNGCRLSIAVLNEGHDCTVCSALKKHTDLALSYNDLISEARGGCYLIAPL